MKIIAAREARALAPGQVLRQWREAPVDRVQIAWYMVASYDLNPIHVDEPFAREAGFGSVIGQGMLPLGFLARELAGLVGLARLRELEGRFVGPVLPGVALDLTLAAAGCREAEGGVELAWALEARDAEGRVCVRGSATTWHDDAVQTMTVEEARGAKETGDAREAAQATGPQGQTQDTTAAKAGEQQA